MKYKTLGFAAVVTVLSVLALAQRSSTQAHVHVINNTNHSVRVTVDGNAFGSLQYIIPNGMDDDFVSPGTHHYRAVATDKPSLYVERDFTFSAGDDKAWTLTTVWTEQ